MELEVLKQEDSVLEFRIKGERHTFPNLLRSVLLKNPEVSFAAYILEHPSDTGSKFVLRTKSKNPKKALQQAVAEISKELSGFEKALKKAVK